MKNRSPHRSFALNRIAALLAVLLVGAMVLAAGPFASAASAREGAGLDGFLSKPDAVKGDGAHFLGFRPSPPGDYVATPLAPKLMQGLAIRSSVDLSSQLPPVGDQGNQGSCVAWATSYYYKTWSEKQEHTGWSLTDTQHRFSPSFMYNQINGGSDNGANFQDAFNVLQNKGDVDIAEMPYNDGNYTTQPTAAQLQAARPYRIPSGWTYFWNRSTYGPYGPANSIDNAKAWIDSGKALVMGIPVYNDFPNFAGSPSRTYYVYNGSSSLAGGHGVCICGYNDNINPGGADADHKGGFKMVNSWGSGWNGSNAGYVYLSYDFVKRYVFEAWTMGDNSPDGPSVTSLSAGSGSVGQSIDINGKNFGAKRRSAKVAFNGTQASQATFINEKVTATVPAGATTGPVVVYDWEGTASNGLTFTVGGGGSSAPVVSSISPNSGLNTGTVNVSVGGSNFASGCQVKLAGSGLPDIQATGENRVSASRVDCAVELTGVAAGARDVVVTNTDGLSGALAGGFTVDSSLADTYEPNNTLATAYGPLAAGISYSSYVFSAGDNDYYRLVVPAGCAGLTATLQNVPAGCDFDFFLYDSDGVELESSRAEGNADELLEWESPAAGTYYLEVTPWSGSSQTNPYTVGYSLVDPPAAPAITGVTPTGGARLTPVIILGSDFGNTRGNSQVSFGALAPASSDYVSWAANRIVVRVPGGVGGKPFIRVTTEGGTSNGVAFKVTPRISTLNPTRGRVGTTVTINGQGFGTWSSGYTCVYFGTQRVISYVSWTGNQIKVRVPAKITGQKLVTVKTAGGTSSAKTFTVY